MLLLQSFLSILYEPVCVVLLWFLKNFMAVQTFHFLVPKSLLSVAGDKTMFKTITSTKNGDAHLEESINDLMITNIRYILQVAISIHQLAYCSIQSTDTIS